MLVRLLIRVLALTCLSSNTAAQFFCFSNFQELENGGGSCGGSFLGIFENVNDCCLTIESGDIDRGGYITVNDVEAGREEECMSCMTVPVPSTTTPSTTPTGSPTSGVILGFFEEDYAAIEGGTVTVTVTKDLPNVGPIGLNILPLTYAEYEQRGKAISTEMQSTIDTLTPAQSNSSGQGDFSSLPINLTFPPSAGSSSLTATVGTYDDFINEAQEGYLIVIEVVSIDPQDEPVNFVREGIALVRIIDNDFIRIEFTQQSYMVNEGAGTFTNVTLQKMDSVQSEQNITVLLNVQSGSAEAGFDYVDPGELSVLFLPSDDMITIPIDIIQDTEAESDENFVLQITIPSDPPSGFQLGLSQSQVIITNNDNVPHEVGFLQQTYTVIEGETAVITYGILSDPTLLDPTNEFAVLDLQVFPGSATSSVDYTFNPSAEFLFLDRSSSTGQILIPTVTDSLIEGIENFTLRLNLSSLPGNVLGGFFVPESNSEATVFILETASSTNVSPTSSTTPTTPSSQSLTTPSGLPTPGTTVRRVNDSVIADPLMTVPLYLTNTSALDINLSENEVVNLCFEIHGQVDQYFNLVSDSCVSVNAHYTLATPQLGFNIIDQIAIRAVGLDQVCRNIAISISCQATIDGLPLNDSYTSAGISVRLYRNRVRISLPNCQDLDLVLWVFCEERELRGYPELGEPDITVGVDMIRFVIARGFNIRETAHGILGQFWNIPVGIEPFVGTLREGSTRDNMYTLTVNYPGSPQRQFVTFLHSPTWDKRGDEYCLYGGNRQGGGLFEVVSPNDPIIEGIYRDYVVDGAFRVDFVFSHFESSQCSN